MIIINELKAFCRDKTALTMMIVLPILLIYLLGNLLSGQDVPDAIVGDLKIAYMDETGSEMEAGIVQAFMEDISREENVIVTKAQEKETARSQVADNELDGFVIFRPEDIMVYEGKNAIKNRTISAIFTGYSYMRKSVNVIAETAPEQILNLSVEGKNFVEEKEFNANRSMLDYYGVSMIVMMTFVGSVLGAGTFYDERRLKTLNRLITSPMSRTNIFLQKVIGQIPSAITEIVIIMLISVLFFDVHYASRFGDNIILLVLFFVTSLTMLTIGILLGMFVKGNPTLYLVLPLWIIMFLSGTFSKEINIKGVTEYMPAYILQQTAFDITVFGRTKGALSIILIELVLIVLMVGIGVVKVNKMKEAK